MPRGRNGDNGRVNDLNAARPWERISKPLVLTPDQARALVDGVLRSYGLDPMQATDPYGWRHLSVGSAAGVVGVVEWQSGDYYLVVLSPVLQVPQDPAGLAGFYRALLELNHHGTMAARFSIHEDGVFIGLTRPIRGLDEEEVDDALRAVMIVADGYDEWLKAQLDAAVAEIPPPLPDLPNIKMTPSEAQTVGAVLAACDTHGREIFRYLVERWQQAAYIVDPTWSGISLKFQLGSKKYSLGGLRPGAGERRQLIILGWEGLRNKGLFPPQAIDRFQSAVLDIAPAKVTETTAHVEVNEAFDKESAKALLRALRALVKAAHPPKEEQPFRWDPRLPKMQLKVGPKTLAGLQESLQACVPRVQQLYALLTEGWNQAGGTVQCKHPGRIYLKFKTRAHNFGVYGVRAHKFNLVVLAAPKGKRGPSIDVAWGLATRAFAYLDYVAGDVARFEAVVSQLPGFEQQGTVTRLVIGEAFQLTHAQTLLKAMLDLKAAGGAP